jgi:heme/copper-type cytochrome/quinol oxidase subunit 3
MTVDMNQPEAYVEPPELLARDLWAGSRLFTGAQAFFFLVFLFAFFYLRALNVNGMWKPHGVDPPRGYGIAILACIVASAVVYWAATRALRRNEAAWRLGAAAALLLAVAAIVVQVMEWTAMDFGPTNGGYASVFVGWTGFYTLTLLGASYWMETLVAESIRGRRSSDEGQALVHRANADAIAVFWYFLAAVGIAAFICLYIVK